MAHKSLFTSSSGSAYLFPLSPPLPLSLALSATIVQVTWLAGVACPLPTSNKQTNINHVPHTPRCPFYIEMGSFSLSFCWLLPVAVDVAFTALTATLRTYRPPLLCLSASRCSSKAVYYAALYFCLRN